MWTRRGARSGLGSGLGSIGRRFVGGRRWGTRFVVGGACVTPASGRRARARTGRIRHARSLELGREGRAMPRVSRMRPGEARIPGAVRSRGRSGRSPTSEDCPGPKITRLEMHHETRCHGVRSSPAELLRIRSPTAPRAVSTRSNSRSGRIPVLPSSIRPSSVPPRSRIGSRASWPTTVSRSPGSAVHGNPVHPVGPARQGRSRGLRAERSSWPRSSAPTS